MDGREGRSGAAALTSNFIGTATRIPSAFAVSSGPEAVLDCGSCLHISGDLDDFYEVEAEPTERLSGMGGKVNGGDPTGHKGIPKASNLGVVKRTYVPPMMKRRLTPTTLLAKDGWAMSMGEDEGKLMRREYGISMPIRYEKGLATI